MLLFLDFDGVLHPDRRVGGTDAPLFCRNELLWRILRACPSVEVVFSTSWRRLYSADELVQLVVKDAPDLLARFIGCTPHLEEPRRPRGAIGQREDEIKAWLNSNGQHSRPWLALDDCADNFWTGCKELYLID